MKRRAILLGHNDGELSTQKDLVRVSNFLQSFTGGNWLPSEIFCKENISLDELHEFIRKVKMSKIDYLFFYFSGHGGYERGTVLELNPQNEVINESEISGIVPRQLNIYDCCRSPVEQEFLKEGREYYKEFSIKKSDTIRHLFEERIMKAVPQQMSLYACSKGECAYDFGDGGIFTTHLLNSTKYIKSCYLLVSKAYISAYQPTVNEAALHNKIQRPDYFMPKVMGSQQLILAINDIHTRF